MYCRNRNGTNSSFRMETLAQLAEGKGKEEEAIVLVKEYLERGFSVNGCHLSRNRVSLLAIAAKANWENLVRYLLEQGADIDQRDTTGSTPLVHAVRSHALGSVKLLVKGGAQSDIKDETGKTALEWALDDNNNKDSIIANYLCRYEIIRADSEQKGSGNKVLLWLRRLLKI